MYIEGPYVHLPSTSNFLPSIFRKCAIEALPIYDNLPVLQDRFSDNNDTISCPNASVEVSPTYSSGFFNQVNLHHMTYADVFIVQPTPSLPSSWIQMCWFLDRVIYRHLPQALTISDLPFARQSSFVTTGISPS